MDNCYITDINNYYFNQLYFIHYYKVQKMGKGKEKVVQMHFIVLVVASD